MGQEEWDKGEGNDKDCDDVGHGPLAGARKLAGLPPDAAVDYPEKKEGVLRKILFGDDSETRLDSVLQSAALQTITLGISPGWRVMLLAPVR